MSKPATVWLLSRARGDILDVEGVYASEAAAKQVKEVFGMEWRQTDHYEWRASPIQEPGRKPPAYEWVMAEWALNWGFFE